MRGSVGRAGAALAALALAACAPERGGALPAPSVASSGSAASASATPRALTKAEIESQALATVRGYYAEVNHALSTGDTNRLEQLMSSTCSCRPLLMYVQDRWRSGRVRGAGYVLRDVVIRSTAPAEVRIRIRYAVSEFQEVDHEGRVTATIPAVPDAAAEIDVRRKGNAWVIDDIAKLGSGQ